MVSAMSKLLLSALQLAGEGSSQMHENVRMNEKKARGGAGTIEGGIGRNRRVRVSYRNASIGKSSEGQTLHDLTLV